jgi:hypothetical protein
VRFTLIVALWYPKDSLNALGASPIVSHFRLDIGAFPHCSPRQLLKLSAPGSGYSFACFGHALVALWVILIDEWTVARMSKEFQKHCHFMIEYWKQAKQAL